MNNFKHLPLIALVSLGVAACGQDDEVDMDGEDTAVIEQEDTLGSDPMASDPMASDPMASDPMMSEEAGMVTVTVSGVQPQGGTVYVGLQDSASFATLEAAYGSTAEPTGEEVEVEIMDVPAGSYAVVAFQDTDGDGTTNLGATGPEEPWGISGYDGGQAPSPMSAMIEVEGDTEADVELMGGM